MRIPGVFATSFAPPGDPVGTALLVPGRGYPPQAPLLFFAGLALLQHGWRVEHHWWDPPAYEDDEQTAAWVRREVEAALTSRGRVMLVGKSLGTWAAPVAAERALEAVWITPILGSSTIADAVAANPAAQLLVGGSADEFWDSAVAARLQSPTCSVAEIRDADHALLAPGDVVRGAELHLAFVRSLDVWLSGLPS